MSRPATTGSKGTTPISFRLSAAQLKRVTREASRRGMSVGQFAKWCLDLVSP